MITGGELLYRFELYGDVSETESLTGCASQLDFATDSSACLKDVAGEDDIDLDLGMLGHHVHVILSAVALLCWVLEATKFEIIARGCSRCG